MRGESGGAEAPAADCPLCPRLAGLRAELRTANPVWHNGPVPSFGEPGARLLIVGLAPGRNGANRTGRPFTGDAAGGILYPSLARHGFARGAYAGRADGGFDLLDCRVTNAVRCLPPQNKPTAAEVNTCRRFLAAEISAMPRLRGILALGRIAHQSVALVLGLRTDGFVHGSVHDAGAVWLADSYHCSLYNLNTGRLTEAMFDAVVAGARRRLVD